MRSCSAKASTTPKDTALHKFLKKMQEKDEDKAVIKFWSGRTMA